METNGETAVAVVRGTQPVGLLTWEAALLSDPEAPVSDSMRGLSTLVEIDEGAQAAARAILGQKMDHAVIVEGGKFRGVVSALALLSELQHSWDPMTNLPWSDRLREWGANRLNEDQEISIVFFDIDEFGKYNKLHGHKVGDDVIKALAAQLESVVDPRTDILVRYAGDEFAIGTLRNRAETEAFVDSLEPMMLRVAEIPDPVRFSAGISGGKRSRNVSRTQEEAAIHVQSTLDNLITLASRACIVAKNRKKEVLAVPAGRLQLLQAAVDLGEQVTAQVVLEENGRQAQGRAEASPRKKLRAVAIAVARALETLHPDAVVQIDDVIVHRDKRGQNMVSVLGHLERGPLTLSFRGTHAYGLDFGTSVALAVCEGYASVA
jgi:diguanylate cyclase (GGDEF)-like protein